MTNCFDVAQMNPCASSGVYEVWIGGNLTSVYCNMTAGNLTGWTVSITWLDGL